ncbi:MAG: pitrilysin family protein [Gemmatimonadota bacterium]
MNRRTGAPTHGRTGARAHGRTRAWRPRRQLGAALTIAFLCGGTSVRLLPAQAVDRTRPPVLPPAPPLRVPPVQTAILPNGLELAVVEMHEVPVVDVSLLFRAGAVRDPADLPGLATFAANMLDEGAGARTALDIAEEVAYLGASFSTFAGVEASQVTLHVPKRRLGPAMDLMADVVLRPTFADSEIARQRDLRRTAIIQLRDQPTAIAPIAFNAIVFGSAHPYGRPAGGTEVSTAALNRDRVAQFYQTYYRPNNARLLIVGDITMSEARRLATEKFGAWARAEVPLLPLATAPAPARRTVYLVDKPGAAQSVIRIGHVGVPRSTPDYAALQVLNTILGGSFTSRLNQNLREEHGYSYGASSRFDMYRMAGPFRAYASVVTAKTDSSLIEFLRELRRVRDEAVPQQELDKAKAYIALGLPSEFETTAGSASQFLDLLGNDLPLDFYGTYVQRVNAVTAADVQRVARQYVDPEHFSILVVGDRSQIEAGIRALNEGPISLRDIWGREVR